MAIIQPCRSVLCIQVKRLIERKVTEKGRANELATSKLRKKLGETKCSRDKCSMNVKSAEAPSCPKCEALKEPEKPLKLLSSTVAWSVGCILQVARPPLALCLDDPALDSSIACSSLALDSESAVPGLTFPRTHSKSELGGRIDDSA